MHSYSDIKQMPYTAQQMYDLVKDIEKYPSFLPWCDGIRVKSKQDNIVIADMMVGYKAISEKFTSRVIFNDEDKKITVYYEKGPFKSLTNQWIFTDIDNGCNVNFDIEFQFKNKLLDMALTPVFSQIVEKMVSSFENRAKEIY